ncbi:MAG: tetratricopeptide repeat protein [Myxococcales bacterium]|nr:tetratricopeptide repeat protein [Myxococcales bacterium]
MSHTRWIVAATLALASAAIAQPAPGTPEGQALAERLFATGKAHYDLGEYAEAATAFKEAYRLTSEPLLLFNIAQAERKQDDCAGALTAYRSYLRNLPDAPNRAKVEEFIADAEACVARTPGEPPPPDRAGPGGAGPGGAGGGGAGPNDGLPLGPPSAAGASGGRTLRYAGIASVGVGVVALGVGAYFARAAGDRAAELEACAAPCAAATWTAIDADGRAAQRNATIGFVAGGVGIAAGATLYVLGVRAHREAPVAIAPTVGGATVQATVRF